MFFKAVLCAFAAGWASIGAAQVGESVNLGSTCSYFGEDVPQAVVTFASTDEAEQVISRIVGASGIAKNFDVRAAGVPNAAAVIQATRRLILYNTGFILAVRERCGSEWAATSIMAHEVGHHLNGHTLEPGGSRPASELEADYFSGFVLQKLGASLPQAQLAMSQLGDPAGSATHPPKHDRLEAIASGWTRACSQDAGCGARTTPPPTPEPQPPRPRPTRDPNGCEHAHDGECDEPDICDPGTDTADCETESRPPRGGADSCEYARDGECDEPGLCERGTDTTDCRLERSRPGPDSCEYANDGECDEPDVCDRGTDTSDCSMTRPRPQPRATACVTPWGACPLPPGPPGIVCTCFTAMGPVQGISQ